jgi:NAD-dependent SIR2 family protein deacetylase
VRRGGARAVLLGPILVLTGAGISVELGLPSFRGVDGLWQGLRLETWRPRRRSRATRG